MNFFKNLFGKKSEPAISPSPARPPLTPTSQAQAPKSIPQTQDLIRVFDGYGRELFITRQQWRDNVLPGSIQAAWHDPDKL